VLTALIDELRISMFCCGAANLAQLKHVELLTRDATR
jgi:isopentenyl diphosphate isomerase/L-lactate dehydrogenase-like FMN-dependent dehydrogenase